MPRSGTPRRSAFTTARSHNRLWRRHGSTPYSVVKTSFGVSPPCGSASSKGVLVLGGPPASEVWVSFGSWSRSGPFLRSTCRRRTTVLVACSAPKGVILAMVHGAVKGIFRLLAAKSSTAYGGPCSLRSPARRIFRGTRRGRPADLALCLLLPPHGPPRTKGTPKRKTTAAGITRGVGRVAAVLPAGEGGRERGAWLVGRAGPWPASDSSTN